MRNLKIASQRKIREENTKNNNENPKNPTYIS